MAANFSNLQKFKFLKNNFENLNLCGDFDVLAQTLTVKVGQVGPKKENKIYFFLSKRDSIFPIKFFHFKYGILRTLARPCSPYPINFYIFRRHWSILSNDILPDKEYLFFLYFFTICIT